VIKISLACDAIAVTLVSSQVLRSDWRDDYDCFSGKAHEDVVKLEVCAIADLTNEPGAKYGIFLLGVAGHMTTRRGPDVARGPDVVHHWSIIMC